MNKIVLTLGLAIVTSFTMNAQEFLTKTGKISFKSVTEKENIESTNFKVVSKLNTATGDMVFSVPMQSFGMEPAMRYKHFNSEKFLDTKQFPKAKFKGKVTNIGSVDLSKDGKYDVTVAGDMTIHGITKAVTEKGTLEVKGGEIKGMASFKIKIADYKIAFDKGKPSTNIAKELTLTVDLDYKKKI